MFCGNGFARKNQLKSHLRIHDEREYSCDICNQKVVGYNKYNSHKAIHQQKPCSVCGNHISKKSFAAHFASCSGNQKEIQCQECEYTSTKKENVKRHVVYSYWYYLNLALLGLA